MKIFLSEKEYNSSSNLAIPVKQRSDLHSKSQACRMN